MSVPTGALPRASRALSTRGRTSPTSTRITPVELLLNALHDWEENRARAILSNCHRAMTGTNARMLVVEDLVCGPNVACSGKMGDANMLAAYRRQEPHGTGYRDLLSAGRFNTRRVIPINDSLAVIEAVPA